MGYLNWPGEGDVLGGLESFGVLEVPEGVDVEGEVASVVGMLERSVGFGPLLAGETAESFVVERDGWANSLVSLPRAFVEVDSVDLEGTVLEKDVDWWLYGEKPWRTVRLRSNAWRGRISVTGRVGLFEEVPADLWGAVRDFVVAKLVESVSYVSGDSAVRKVRQDSVSVEYGSSGLEPVLEMRNRAVETIRAWSGGFGMGGA